MPPVAGRPGPQKQLLSAAMRQRPARYCRAPMGLSTDSAVAAVRRVQAADSVSETVCIAKEIGLMTGVVDMLEAQARGH